MLVFEALGINRGSFMQGSVWEREILYVKVSFCTPEFW
ncbi:Uncharacterised protein [Yersinia pseudotuberculosis]|uniref:Uncharacterized protein n=1 Tax=Yersinia pseudotuberculosis TaxID=633 RepID=A0A380SCU8_YERPU|nr:Uncharacterised protein [Yersinia pseudotuberculosis]